MGLLKYDIFLDQPVYYSGQTITGKLVVEVDKPMLLRGIRYLMEICLWWDGCQYFLKLSGQGSVYWTETHQRHVTTRTPSGGTTRVTQSYTQVYSSSEQYLGLQQLIYGTGTDCELTQGEHVFVFNYQLPINLPSSFEGPYGRIRYSVKATIDRPWKMNHVKKRAMTIISVFDLNCNPFAAAPVSEQVSKTFWGSSKQLFMAVNIPVRGFVPGQIIPIKVSLKNDSKVKVQSIYVTLKQNITFHATTKSRAVKMYVFKNEFPVQKGSGEEEFPLNFQLPSVPPSHLEFCRIIDLNYQLNVRAKVKAWYHTDLKIPMEIIVGNIPLMSYQRPIIFQQQRMPNDSIARQNPSCCQAGQYEPPAYGLVVPPGMTYGDLPPPTYEQSMGLVRSEKENPENHPDSDGEVTEFAPLYPVYKFGTGQG